MIAPRSTLALLALLPRQVPTTLSIFAARGRAAMESAALGWGLIVISVIVFLIFLGFLALPLWRNRGRGDLSMAGAAQAVRDQHDHPDEIRGILLLGLALPALVLAAVFVWSTIKTSAQAQPFAVNDPDASERADAVVIGHQWWWEVRYPRDGVLTANELHVPVGRRVRIALSTEDVNHSFWVPQLAGKTDLVAGQVNTIWLEADTAGTYYGECAEFCGPQHAHMGFTVVAESPADYADWLATQHAPAVPATQPEVQAGRAAFASLGCAGCHAVRGTVFQGRAGPDLTHLASRATLAAGTLPNTRGDLAGWVADPQRVKPGNRMPVVAMSGTDLQAVVAYLESLH
ncbi:MAG TPA: cytochrome c oxidase subunit II [Gemmatirosa sp.]